MSTFNASLIVQKCPAIYEILTNKAFTITDDLISWLLLRSMPLGNNEDLGRGYDDMIGCATCSLSQRLMQ